jgi:hypothetical protein
MARTALATPTRGLETGVDLEAVDAVANLTDGNYVPWHANLMLWVLNGDDTSLTVTVPTPGTVGRSGLAIGDAATTVPATKHRLIGPFGPEFRQSDGNLHINYSGADASVTIVAVDARP